MNNKSSIFYFGILSHPTWKSVKKFQIFRPRFWPQVLEVKWPRISNLVFFSHLILAKWVNIQNFRTLSWCKVMFKHFGKMHVFFGISTQVPPPPFLCYDFNLLIHTNAQYRDHIHCFQISCINYWHALITLKGSQLSHDSQSWNCHTYARYIYMFFEILALWWY